MNKIMRNAKNKLQIFGLTPNIVYRTLTYNDEQFHILEKIKMQETMRDLVELLQKQSQPTVNQVPMPFPREVLLKGKALYS